MRSFGLMARSWQLCRGKTYAFGRAWCFRCSDLWRVVRRWRLGSASTSLLPWVASAVEDKPDIDNSPRASCGHLRVNEGCLVFPAAQWLPDGHPCVAEEKVLNPKPEIPTFKPRNIIPSYTLPQGSKYPIIIYSPKSYPT